MSRRENNGAGKLKLALVGLGLMLIADIVADLTLFVGEINAIHWGEFGVTAVSWILIIIALVALKHKRKEFARGLVAAIVGLLALCGEAMFVVMNIRAQISGNPFVAMKPMFCEYFSDLMMLLVMYLLVRGSGQLIAKSGDMQLAQQSIRKSNLNPIIAMIAMVLVPFGTAFSMPFSIIIGAIGVVVNAAMRLDMMNYVKIGGKIEG